MDPGQLDNCVRDLFAWVNFGLKVINDLTILDQHTANLNDPITVVNICPGRFQVHHGVNWRLLVTFSTARLFLLIHIITESLQYLYII